MMSRIVLIALFVISTALIVAGCSDSADRVAGPGGNGNDAELEIRSMMEQMARVMPVVHGVQDAKVAVGWPGGNNFVVSVFDTSGSQGTDMLIYYGAIVADDIASVLARKLTPAALQGQAGSDTVHIHAPEGLVILDVTWEAAPASVPLHPRLGQSPRTDFQVKISCVAADVGWDFDIYYGVTDTGDVIYMEEDGARAGFKYAVRDFDGTSEFWFSRFRGESESHTYVELTASTFRAKFVRSDPPYGVTGYFGGGVAQHVGDDVDEDDSWLALRSYYNPADGDAESVYGILTYTEAKDLDYDGQYPQGIENLAGDSTRSVAGYVTPGHPSCLFADEAAMLSFFAF